MYTWTSWQNLTWLDALICYVMWLSRPGDEVVNLRCVHILCPLYLYCRELHPSRLRMTAVTYKWMRLWSCSVCCVFTTTVVSQVRLFTRWCIYNVRQWRLYPAVFTWSLQRGVERKLEKAKITLNDCLACRYDH